MSFKSNKLSHNSMRNNQRGSYSRGCNNKNNRFIKNRASNYSSATNQRKAYYDKSENKFAITDPGKFYCETCDRDFRNQGILDQHKSEHQKCGIDGCTFVAHPNVVTKHIQMQHSSGLYNKIKNLNTAEDIAKWIAERKKNYPTKENIDKRKAQKTECIDRGERLFPNKRQFNNNHDNKGNQRGKNQNRSNKRQYPNQQKSDKDNTIQGERKKPKTSIKPKDSKKPLPENEEETYCNLPAFKGTSLLRRNDLLSEDVESTETKFNDIEIDDDEWMEDTKKEDNSVNFAVCNVLGQLIDSYKSSDDEELEDIEEKNDEKLQPSTSHIVQKDIAETLPELSDDSGPEEIKISSASSSEPVVETEPSEKLAVKRKAPDKTVSKEPKEKVQRRMHQKMLPKSLLEKLLEKDIRHERNVLLQCVHHIVKNNFFKEE